MGKSLSKASNGGKPDVLKESLDFTQGEFQYGFDTCVPLCLKVRPCLRRSGFAQAGRTLSERFTHVRLIAFFAMLR